MDPDSTDEMVDHLVDFFDQVAPDYDGWAQGHASLSRIIRSAWPAVRRSTLIMGCVI